MTDRNSEAYMENALDEYNQRIPEITDPVEMLEALIGRGSVLMLLGSYISAISDLEDAADILDELESSGRDVDAGLYVKIYTDLGGMAAVDESLEHYRKAMERLPELNPGSRYFDPRKIAEMCIRCAFDLSDMDKGKDALVFLNKAKDVLTDDAWSKNRLADIYGLMGQIHRFWNRYDAMDMYDKAIDVAESLISDGTLECMDDLVLSYIGAGDIQEELGSLEDALRYHKRAAELMELMLENGETDDIEVLSNIYKGMAENLFKLGKAEEGEMMLIKAMRTPL